MGLLTNVFGGVKSIAPRDARTQQKNGALLLDVRENSEWADGHAPDARHIPLKQLPNKLNTLSKATPIVVCCRTGKRSAKAAKLLKDEGYEVRNLRGGMKAWQSAGLPVEDHRKGKGRI